MAKAATTPANSEADAGGQVAGVTEIKEIPLGMGVDEMKVSNAEAVLSIEDAGKKAGAEEERNRLAALQAEFPDDPKFVAECQAKAGFTVTDAKAAKFEQFKAANAELVKKNEELTKAAQAKDPSIEFASSDKEAGGGAVDEGTVDEKDAKSITIWNGNAKLREAYNGNKGAFQATYRNDPETAMSFGK